LSGEELDGHTGYLSYGYRYYSADLGRWFNPDPARQFASPYVFNGNNPIITVDPDGKWVICTIGAIVGAYQGYQYGRAKGKRGWDLAGYIVGGAVIGAASAFIDWFR
jgi:RHS repeat-associated protein